MAVHAGANPQLCKNHLKDAKTQADWFAQFHADAVKNSSPTTACSARTAIPRPPNKRSKSTTRVPHGETKMTMDRLFLVTMIVAAALTGCGKKDEGGAAKKGDSDNAAEVDDPALPKRVAGGCYNADTGICTYNKESDPEMCKALSGTFNAGECPKQDAVPGTCTCKTEYNTEVKTYYTTSGAKYTPGDGKAGVCESAV